MKSKTYFITLTPEELFFFGREQGEKADYYLKGSFWPQQTALLGLVRHQILIQNHLLEHNKIKDNSLATNWIGSTSFEYNQRHKFGKIESLSPCYLVKKENQLIRYLPYHQSYVNGIKRLNENFFLPNYDPKNYYPDRWLSLDKQQCLSNTQNKIYREVERVGVNKNYNGKTEKESFFKQIWIKMNKGFAFGFYITLTDDVTFNTNTVTFGKENTPFLMQVEEQLEEKFVDESKATALVLTSDAYVDEDLLSYSDFAITDTISFRNIINTTSTNHNHYGLHKSKVRLQLYKRGTIFFSSDTVNMNFIKEAIHSESNLNFKDIGYNHFHLLNIHY